jgi:hypothetical protein
MPAGYAVSLSELTALSQQFGLRLLRSNDSEDRPGRTGVSGSNAVHGLPDDGLGALPLLRHLMLASPITANGSTRH